MTYRSTFPQPHALIAVIHAETALQTMRNVERALNNGAHGVFLINHEVPPNTLMRFYEFVSNRYPDAWIGINLLGLKPSTARSLMATANGLWADDAGICNSGDVSKAAAFSVTIRKPRNWLYFGGVAFKHQERMTDYAAAARKAMPFMDVITTSGEETGRAPDVHKIRVMKEAVGDHPLAIASGMTPENVHLYKPYADCFLVATGISDSHTELNPKLVHEFAMALL